MVSQIQSGILIASYTYDSQNRMTAATTYGISRTLTETYNYDALGNRIAKTTDGVKTEYLIDYSTGYAQVLRATTAGSTIFYTRGFELISRKDATRELWYLTDGGGSIRFLTDSTGSVTDSLVFDAFGNTVSRTGQTGDSYGFQGEQQDATGLYYLRARYMNPATGSFTQMDTYGGSLSDPMSLHKYLFANANPVKYRDPSGHESVEEAMGTVGIISILAITTISLAIFTNVQQNRTTSFNIQVVIRNIPENGIHGNLSIKILTIIQFAVLQYINKQIANWINEDAKDVSNDDDETNESTSSESASDDKSIPQFPGNDSTESPGDGWEWRGKGNPSSGDGSWYNPKTGETLHPDLNHPEPIGPHWDYNYKGSNTNGWRIYPDGRIVAS